jgi:dTDP-glucose 4,6-dehydratase
MLREHPEDRVINLDKLTYAGNLANLKEVEDNPNYTFVYGDIADQGVVEYCMAHGVSAIVNFAAETHVDRSIDDPGAFINTDMYGTFVLLEAAKRHGCDRFVQISTDEVYGEVMDGHSVETDPLMPRNPYSASKAGADRLAYSYFNTYGTPVLITRASNNFGPFQYPEKLIPLFVTNALEDKPLPVYGDGQQIRDWLYVMDHCSGVDFVLRKGTPGEVYNIGGGNEKPNLEITQLILEVLDKPDSLIKYVTDRPGHDRRYALSSDKLRGLGWAPTTDFASAMRQTIEWYRDNRAWWEPIKSGAYREYYEKTYGGR